MIIQVKPRGKISLNLLIYCFFLPINVILFHDYVILLFCDIHYTPDQQVSGMHIFRHIHIASNSPAF